MTAQPGELRELAKGKSRCIPALRMFRYFQISVPVQQGNSGRTLVDERGNVIGILSARADASAALTANL